MREKPHSATLELFPLREEKDIFALRAVFAKSKKMVEAPFCFAKKMDFDRPLDRNYAAWLKLRKH